MTHKNLKTWMSTCMIVLLYDFAAEGISNLCKAGESYEEKEAWKYLFTHLLSIITLLILLTPYEFIGIENAHQFYISLGIIHFSFLSFGCIYQLNSGE
ncbi:hypothetical protein V7S76_04050 [Aquirufa sp. ROCK2-A2]